MSVAGVYNIELTLPPLQLARPLSPSVSTLTMVRFVLFATLLCSVPSLLAQDTSLRAVEEAFNKANITRDLQIHFKPSLLLEVTWPQSSGKSIATHTGQYFPRNATAGPPHFAVRGQLPRHTHQFVLAAVDPDAPYPTNPNVSQVRHLLQGDVVPVRHPRDHQWILVNETAPVSVWLQPAPPADSPPHRYIFLLYEQPRDFNKQTFVTANTSIEFFNLSTFAREVHLRNPIAGSFVLVSP